MDSKIFVTADTHFNEEEIMRRVGRNFSNVEEMNEYIILRWNKTVPSDATVFHLGDFGVGSTEELKNIIMRLNGEITLILGNHDCGHFETYYEVGIKMVSPYPIIIKDYIILSHEPKFLPPHSPYLNLYGHVHNDNRYKTVAIDSACMCTERWSYTPVHLQNILNKIGTQSLHS